MEGLEERFATYSKSEKLNKLPLLPFFCRWQRKNLLCQVNWYKVNTHFAYLINGGAMATEFSDMAAA